MSRRATYLVLGLLVMGVAVAIGAWQARAGGDDVPVTSSVPAAAHLDPVPPPATLSSIPDQDSMQGPASPDDIARWSVDAVGGDAALRASAIAGLARAPVAQALPILRRVLISGEPAVDRPLALASLRELALERGDADGAIRAVVREAIYHADDVSNVEATQDVLDVIEESELK